MDLPEAVCGDLEGVLRSPDGDLLHDRPGTRLAGVGGGDQAVVDGDDVVRAVLPHASAATRGGRVALTGPPAQPVLVAGDRLDDQAGDQRVLCGQATQADQLLAQHRRLQLSLGGQGDVLEVAAAAEAGTGVGARRNDPFRCGRDHRDRVPAPEPVAGRSLGDLDDDLLTGEGVAYEDDAGALPGRASLDLHAGDEVAAVGDRADLDLEATADVRLALRRLRTGPPSAGRGTLRAAHRRPLPRRRPGASQYSSRSSSARSLPEASW